MKVVSALRFILTFIFFVHSSAWAYGGSSLEKKAALEKFVQTYNSLSFTEKKKEFSVIMKSMPEEDKKTLQRHLRGEFPAEFPVLSIEDGSIIIPVDGTNYSVTYVETSKFKIQNKVIEFLPGKLEAASLELESALSTPKSTFFNYFLSPAYAAGLAWKVVGIILVILSFLGAGVPALFIAGVGSLGVGFMKSDEANEQHETVKNLCAEAKKLIKEIAASSDKSAIDTALKEIRYQISMLNANLGCTKSNDTECVKAKACLIGISDTISKLGLATDGDRAPGKVISDPKAPVSKGSGVNSH